MAARGTMALKLKLTRTEERYGQLFLRLVF